MKGGPSKLKSIVHFTMKNKTEEGGGVCYSVNSAMQSKLMALLSTDNLLPTVSSTDEG